MKIRISNQNELVKCDPQISRTVFTHILGRGDRSITTDFTPRSRKNLLEKFAVLDPVKSKSPIFITLTYVKNFKDHKEAYRHLDLFLKRITYKKEGTYACWRKELQERGAIHFHIMLWGVKYIPKEKIGKMWGAITRQYKNVTKGGITRKYPPFTRIERCQSRRKAWHYISKYISKVGKEKNEEKGIAPSLRGKFSDALKSNAGVVGYPQPETFDHRYASGFNYDTNSEKPESTGRWWGWFNRKNIPLAPEMITELEISWAEYQRFRWDLRWIAGHTSQTHLTHTVKLFWFQEELGDLSPLIMLLSGMMGETVFKNSKGDVLN